MMPFTHDEFFAAFAAYNEAVWPMQVVLVFFAVMTVILAARPGAQEGRAVAILLGLQWLWMGLVYHLAFFSRVTPAALVFGAAFIAQGVLFLHAGARGMAFRLRAGRAGVAGGALVAYALLAYPLIGALAGQTYPAAPTYGLPCPTTIFTLGVLLWSERRVPARLLAVPLAWSVITIGVAVAFGVVQDLALPAAGALAAWLLLARGGPARALSMRGAR